jgi:protein phosphatase
MKIDVQGVSDIGLRRSQNEDQLAWWISPDGGDPAAVVVVADGMGGANAGEIASQLAVTRILEGARSLGPDAGPPELRHVIEEANRVVHQESLAHPERHGMGTTCTAVLVVDRVAIVAHVGDSRAYLIRGSTIRQLTRDHSLVAQLVELRHLTPEQARVDPRRNVVTRSLGVGAQLEVDTMTVALESGDMLLVSTDGLHGLIDDEELAQHANGADLGRAVRSLVDLARARGGPDNITVALGRITFGDRL